MNSQDMIRFAVAVYLIGAIAVFAKQVANKVSFVRGGKPERRSDQVGRRIGLFFTEVIGQSRVRERAAAGWAHAFVFWGFLAFAISTLDLLVRLAIGGEGFLVGPLGGLSLAVDGFAFLILAGILFLGIRRYVFRPQFLTYYSAESAIVLVVIGIIAATHLGERYLTGTTSTYFGYAHLMVAFSFLAYVPTSKHFHILGGPVNAVLQQLEDEQKMDYMDLEAELDESKGEAYGFNRLEHFSWTDRLDLITCIECGRCQEACPAHATGKLLNPRDFIVDLKYHAKGLTPHGKQALVAAERFAESGEGIDGVPLEQQPLIDHVIAQDTLWQCTSCMACVGACPVNIDHLSMLLPMRRYQVLDVGDIPSEYQRVFTNMERAGDPWGYGAHRKTETVDKLGEVPVAKPGDDFEVLFWVGCWGLYDDRSVETTKATLKVLDHFGVDYRIFGDTEVCCGENYRRMGNELQFQMNAQSNLELFGSVTFKRLMVTNPHCHQVFGKDYRDFVPEDWGGLPFEVVSVEQEVSRLVRWHGLPGDADGHGPDLGRVAYHDSCFYGRYNGIYEEQRALVQRSGGKLVELERSREKSFCCGAGGGNFWREEEEPRVSWNRADEVMKADAPTLAVSCPFCMAMLEDGLKAQDGYDERPVKVKHVVELVADAIGDGAPVAPEHAGSHDAH